MLPLGTALVVMVLVFSFASEYFLTPNNLANLLIQVAPLALVATAAMMGIVMGEIDMSLGSVAGLSGAIGAIMLSNENMPWPLAILIAMLVGFGICGLQGSLVVLGKVQSFAVTLAGFFVWYGVQVGVLGVNAQVPVRREPLASMAATRIDEVIALPVTIGLGILLIAGRVVIRLRDTHESRMPKKKLWITTAALVGVLLLVSAFVFYLGAGGGLPLVFVMSLAIIAVIWLVLSRTRYGRHVYAVGGNMAASRAMGISVGRVKWTTFAIAGVLGATGGLGIISYTGGADTSTGAGSYMLQAIGAAVVGGAGLTGGRGSVIGALGGALLLGGVQNGLALMSLDFYVLDIALGGVVLLALFADSQIRQRLLHK
jgi:D-xylose transport system permease protein